MTPGITVLTKEVSYKIWAEKEDIILRKEYITCINPPILLIKLYHIF